MTTTPAAGRRKSRAQIRAEEVLLEQIEQLTTARAEREKVVKSRYAKFRREIARLTRERDDATNARAFAVGQRNAAWDALEDVKDENRALRDVVPCPNPDAHIARVDEITRPSYVVNMTMDGAPVPVTVTTSQVMAEREHAVATATDYAGQIPPPLVDGYPAARAALLHEEPRRRNWNPFRRA